MKDWQKWLTGLVLGISGFVASGYDHPGAGLAFFVVAFFCFASLAVNPTGGGPLRPA